MTTVIHQFRNTKLQLWPVINVAECLTELRHDKIRRCPTESTLCQARVQGGGSQGACPPPPQKLKSKKKVIRANFKLFHLYFATFLVENAIFSSIF